MRQRKKRQEGCEVGEGLDPRLLTLKTEEGGHKPRNAGGLRKLGMVTPDSQQGNRDLVLQPEGTVFCQHLE